jgi:glycosyltransferase involved in cell wall biosynthesis
VHRPKIEKIEKIGKIGKIGKLGKKGKVRYFLSLNRFESRKNIELALDAYVSNLDYFTK